MNKLPYAEDIPYFQTSQSGSDTWIERTKKLINDAGGKQIKEAYVDEGDRSAFMISFVIGSESYKIMWPVLPTKSNKQKAAKIQAATLMYHDVKSRCITSMVFGSHTAFLPFLLMADGRTASQVTTPELTNGLPGLITLPTPASEVIEGTCPHGFTDWSECPDCGH